MQYLTQDVVDVHSTGGLIIGIALALVGAVLMSFGTQYQSRGVAKIERLNGSKTRKKFSLAPFLRLVSRPSWLCGTLMLAAAVGVQMGALYFAPLIVVQPLGVVALIVTAILNARISKIALPGAIKSAITMCVIGIVAFVLVAAFTATDKPVDNSQLLWLVSLFGGIAGVLLVIYFLVQKKSPALFYIVGTGILYGFVATFAKTAISRISAAGFEPLTVFAVVCLIVGGVLGMMFVQKAHASGPPDLIIAGLTVIDPIVAVVIGIVVLGEAAAAPFWAFIVFVVTGAIAISGVFVISKFHPQAKKRVK